MTCCSGDMRDMPEEVLRVEVMDMEITSILEDYGM
jgi:hypothetical protein